MSRLSILHGIWVCCLITALPIFAQPGDDIYLFSLQLSAEGKYHVSAPKFVSGFNKGGSTIQPSFTRAGDLLVSVQKTGESQYDIWQLSYLQKKFKRITLTSTDEYFPQMHPDGQHLSWLRNEDGIIPDHQVYSVNLRSHKYSNVSGEINDIRNYVWMNTNQLAFFSIEGKETWLSYFDVSENQIKRITTSVGHTLLADKEGMLNYIHKFDESNWYIKKYNPSSSFIDVVTVTPGKTEEITLAKDGTYFIAKDHILYSINPTRQATWNQVADLSVYGINFITGLAVSDDRQYLALAVSKVKP